MNSLKNLFDKVIIYNVFNYFHKLIAIKRKFIIKTKFKINSLTMEKLCKML